MTIKIHRIGIHLVRTNLCHNKKCQVQGYHLMLKNYSTETNAQEVKKEEKIEFNPSLIHAFKNIFRQPTVLPVESDLQNFQKSIKVSSEAEEIFHPPTYIKNDAHVSGLDAYHELYRQSMEEPNEFWKNVTKELHFEKWSDKGLEYNFDNRKGEVFVKFMEGAQTNMAYNCLERNIQKGLGSKIAYIWEGNEPGDQMTITYQELLDQVVKFAEVLRTKGVKKGDVVAIYLPMTIELPVAMLACARIGAIHSVVFAGFSSDALANRIHQAKAKILITADGFYRGHKAIDLKTLADKAFSICHDQGHDIDSVIMVEHLKRIRTPQGVTSPEVKINKKTDSLWNKEMEAASSKNLQTSKIEWNDSEDPLFILYTSGSTGTPKGLVHTTTGYMTYAYEAAKTIFDSKPDDVFWCTADIGWITGHTFGVYGALLNGMTSVLFEGVPNYPDASRMWQLVEKYKVSKLYTSPTAVRSLMDCPTEMVTDYSRDTLKILGVVGEPINRPAWRWLHKVVGGEKCAIVDTYWQTETGGPMLTPLPGATPTKPGSATMPFFGVDPVLVDDYGVAKKGQVDGNLCFARAWPGMARTIWGDHARFIKTYFSTFPGFYFTGDGARRDHDSYYWVGGRVDDKLNVSGHLLSTSEIECVLTHHPTVQEAAVVAAPHPSKGQVPYAFVVLKQSKTLTADLIHEIKQEVRNKIGPFAAPEVVHGASGLPKTRSGKITRRILRIIAEGDHKASLGDTSTLIDEQVIAHLWETRPNVQFCK